MSDWTLVCLIPFEWYLGYLSEENNRFAYFKEFAGISWI